ncbi:MAG TPA: aldehyde dehydrogenase family protein, partial [Cellvibrionaceae bacterium]|nr:aldehyde dehydrogenase family protein [Cellvibrionaceae bacterium]
AARAQPAWAALSGLERGAILRRWGELMLAHERDLAVILTSEQGKPLAEARAEIAYAASYFYWFAGEAERVYGRVLPVGEGRRHWVEQRPLGIVAAITPWNFPAAMLARKLAAALAAGNAVITKPALETPLSALAMVHLGLQAGLPADLVSVLLSDEPAVIGAWFCQAPSIAKISFTGSTATGKWLLERAGSFIKPCSMELGGNAPFIVFADADIHAAVEGFMACKFRNAGQTCISANRLLLAASIADVFLAELKNALDTLNYGDGMDADIQLGPLIHRAACERLGAKIERAKAQGAKVEFFGRDKRVHAVGAFFAPSLVTGVTPSMQLFSEESFGPVVAVTEFTTVDEALALANQTPYGLAAYVFGQNVTTLNRCQRQLQFGMLGINEARISHAYAPFGGVKNSGFGREGGLEGIGQYQSQQFVAWGE